MKIIIRVVLPCLFFSLLAAPALANQRRPSKPRITGMYSSLHYVKEAGDIVGMEVFIMDGGDGYYATVQIAEGAPAPPVLVKVEVRGPVIVFILLNSSALNLGKFTGTITARGMVGKFQNAEKAEFLSRRKSYWQ